MTGNRDIATFTFTVKESGISRAGERARAYLVCEPKSNELGILNGGSLNLRLLDGTTVEHAEEIARYLRTHIAGIQYVPPRS